MIWRSALRRTLSPEREAGRPGVIPFREKKKQTPASPQPSERFSIDREISRIPVTEKNNNAENGREGESSYSHPPQPLNTKRKLRGPDTPASSLSETKITIVASFRPDSHQPRSPFLESAPVRPVDVRRAAFRTFCNHISAYPAQRANGSWTRKSHPRILPQPMPRLWQ
jgi:hypothetical protein